MQDEDLCYLSATAALKLFKTKSLSPVELLGAIIRRTESLEGPINCFADRYFEEALAKAKAAERRFARGSKSGALEGLPLAVKDAQRIMGKRTTNGSLIFKDHVDDHSDPMIERLEAAGAIIFARTTTPEFCLSGACHSRLWGVTRNPWNLEFGPGGSSGGSGAALAAGLTLLATGTDIGGSIRIPASACGVVGFKPPHGRNPHGPPANFDRFDHCGPMTRTIADAALLQGVTAGAHAHDHDSLRDVVALPSKAKSIRGMKIAYSIDFGYVPVDAEVQANTLAALKIFKSLGAQVEEVELGWTADVDRDCAHWYNTMHFGRQTVWHADKHPELMTDYALKFAEVARATTVGDVHKAFPRAHLMYQSIGPILATHDLFICPTLNIPGVRAEHDPADRNFKINGVTVDGEMGWEMTHQFNMLQNLPVLAVPSGFAKSGVPTGIQLVGRSFDDATPFRAGLAYEQELGGWFTPKNRPLIQG